MTSDRRRIGLGLAIVLFAGSLAWLANAWTRAVRPQAEQSAVRTSLAAKDSGEKEALDDLGAILGRDIFHPVAAGMPTPTPGGTPTPSPVSPNRTRSLPSAEFNIPPALPGMPAPTGVPARSAASESGPAPPVNPAPAPTPRNVNLAITGVVGSGSAVRVLIENRDSGESCWAQVGEEVFGYRVVHATDRGGLLSRDGRLYVLKLGANKPRPTPVPTATPTQKPEESPTRQSRYGDGARPSSGAEEAAAGAVESAERAATYSRTTEGR